MAEAYDRAFFLESTEEPSQIDSKHHNEFIYPLLGGRDQPRPGREILGLLPNGWWQAKLPCLAQGGVAAPVGKCREAFREAQARQRAASRIAGADGVVVVPTCDIDQHLPVCAGLKEATRMSKIRNEEFVKPTSFGYVPRTPAGVRILCCPQ